MFLLLLLDFLKCWLDFYVFEDYLVKYMFNVLVIYIWLVFFEIEFGDVLGNYVFSKELKGLVMVFFFLWSKVMLVSLGFCFLGIGFF